MDDAPMDHALDASALAGGDMNVIANPSAKPTRVSPFPWDTYVRCLFLTCIVAMAGYMAWGPGLLRLSILMSHVAPSRGDNLAWRPAEDTTVFVQPAKRTPATPEWRLTSAHNTSWTMQRPDADVLPSWRGGRMSGSRWQRSSYNPWAWRDDYQSRPRREAELAGVPVQKPPTSFRSTEWEARFSEAVPETREQTPALAVPALATTAPETPAPSASPMPLQIPALAPLTSPSTPLELPRLSAGPDADEMPAEPVKPESSAAPAIPAIPVAPADTAEPPETAQPVAPIEESAEPAVSVETVKPAAPSEPERPITLPSVISADTGAAVLPMQLAPSATESLRPAQSVPAPILATESTPETRQEPAAIGESSNPLTEPAALATEVAPEQLLPNWTEPVEAVQPTAPAVVETPGEIDWKDREITEPIPDAYLTIYPKLRFVGLCVPGQGYIRKYYQVAVPEDLAQPKLSGQDGRTPFGKYYVAGRAVGGDGTSLYLSWPSPEDARRIGLDAAATSAIEGAWAAHTLPPQSTLAGGGVTISAQHGSADATTGGFALERPQMEELSTALPDGAWIFVQE